MVQLYNDNVGEVLRKYSADSSVTVGPNESNVSATGVQQIVAGNGINLDPAGGQGVVTVSANLDSALSTYTGNLQAGNITSLGNVTANFFLGNGAFLTGISAANVIGGYSNANVANYLQVLTSNVTTTANISGAYILGNGYYLSGIQFSNIIGAYGNANVTNFLATGFGSNTITTTGNVTAGYFLGNGAFLTGLPEAYSNANVANFLQVLNSNVTTTANVQAAYFLGNGYYLTDIQASNIIGGYGNANVAQYLSSNSAITILTTSNITTAANLQGQYVLGNGRFLTGLPEAYSNANVANYLPTYMGNLQSGNLLVIDSVVIQGNLQVQGNTTYINSNVVNIDDKDIVIANGAVTASQANGAGLIVGQGNLANIIFNNPANAWTLYPGVQTTGNVSGTYILGNGYFLTGVQYGNLVGAYGNANVSNFLANGFGSNTITTTGNIQAGTVKGTNFQATTSAGGTLKNSSGTTQASWGAGGGDNFSVAVSTNLDGANAQIDISPTGTGHVHIKPTGTGAVEIAPTNIGSINNMVIGNVTPAAANVTTLGATGNVTAAYYFGNGYFLTGIQASNIIGGYSNANVANYLPTYTGNISANNISVVTNLTVGDIIANYATVAFDLNVDQIYGGNAQFVETVSANNINVTETIQANNATITNDVAANNFVGIGNSNTTITTNIYTWTFDSAGNLSLPSNTFAVNYANGTAVNLGGSYSNVNVANYLASNANVTITVGVSNITTQGNISGNFYLGNGAQLTGLARGNVYSLQYKDADGNLNGIIGVTTDTNNTGVEFAAYTTLGNTIGGNLPVTPGDRVNSGGYSGIAYGNGRYVAIAGYNTSSNIAINSTNGTSWSYGNLPANITYPALTIPGRASSVIFANGNFIVSTRSNTIYTSTDGNTWNTITANANVHSIQSINGVYSAVLSANIMGISLASSNNLTNWSNVAETWQGSILNRATGNGIFAISTYSNIGGNFLTNVYTSSDAITYTASPINPFFAQLTANTFINPVGGQMAYGDDGWVLFKPTTGSNVPYSPDTDNLVSISTDNFVTDLQFSKPTLGVDQLVALAAGGGLYLAVGGLPTNQMIYSYDGRNWSSLTAPYSWGWGGLAYGNEFVGVTTFQDNYAVFDLQGAANLIVPVNNFYAPGGVSAGQVLTLANANTGSVYWANSGGSYGNSNVASYLQVLTSNVTTTANVQANYFIGDGSQLTNVSIAITPAVADFTFSGLSSNGAVTDEFVNYTFSSDYSQGNGNVSGTSWTRYTTAGGEKAAVSDTGVFITDNEYSINGGTTWATLGSSPPATTFGLAFGNVSGTPTWIRVASGGVIQYNNNANGIPTGTWTAATETASGLLYAAAYGNGVFMAAGDDAKAWFSTNGITFTGSTTNPSAVRGLLWDGTRWLAIGNGGLFYSTDNGANWTRVGVLTFGSFPGAMAYNGVSNGIYRISGGSASTIYWCNGDPTVSGNWVTQSTVANLSIQNGSMQFIGNTWFASGAGIWRTSDSNANIWIADTTTGRTGTLGGYARSSNAAIFVSTAEIERIQYNPQGIYSIGLPADPTYGANTITFTPSSGANANVAATDLGNLIVANRPTYSASYANSRITVIDTNSGGDISGAFTVTTVSLPIAGTISLSVNDGANAVQDTITFTDPVSSATFQYSPAFNSNISNIVTGIANTETLPDWSATAFDSDTVRFTSLIPGFLPTNSLVSANITNGLSNGVITTLAVSRTVVTNGTSGVTVPGGTTGQLQYNANGSFEGTSGITYDATTTLLDVGSFLERANITGTGITGNINYDIITQGILFYNANATANANINFRGNSSITFNNSLGTGDTITVRLLNTNGATAYLPVNYTIDGSNVTPKWLNATAPTAANANSTMQYEYTIVKTAANTYTVLASQQRFA